MSIAEKILQAADNTPKVYQAGQKSEYDRFWNGFQRGGNRTNYWYGFSGAGWTQETLNPKYPVVINDSNVNSQYAIGMFYRANCDGNYGYLDFSKVSDKFDFSGVQRAANLFDSARFDNVVADLSAAVHAQTAFGTTWGPGVRSLKLKVTEALQNTSNMFQNSNLAKVEMMEGSVWATSISFEKCPLDKASITSIVNALAASPNGSSGLITLTLSLNAVKSAFETSPGAADGHHSPEWDELIWSKPAWNINLA